MFLLAGKFWFISTIDGRKGESVLFIFCPLFDTFPGRLPKGTKDWGKEGNIKFVIIFIIIIIIFIIIIIIYYYSANI